MKILEKIKKIFNKEYEDENIEMENDFIEEDMDLIEDEKNILDLDEVLENGPITTSIEEDYGPQIENVETNSSLLEGWHWKIYNDGSGSLVSPTGNSYFHFDWSTYEYSIYENEHYSYFGDRDDNGNPLTFEDFKKYAEEYAIKKLVNLQENQIIEDNEEDEEEI